jgi:hypothetical protein
MFNLLDLFQKTTTTSGSTIPPSHPLRDRRGNGTHLKEHMPYKSTEKKASPVSEAEVREQKSCADESCYPEICQEAYDKVSKGDDVKRYREHCIKINQHQHQHSHKQRKADKKVDLARKSQRLNSRVVEFEGSLHEDLDR